MIEKLFWRGVPGILRLALGIALSFVVLQPGFAAPPSLQTARTGKPSVSLNDLSGIRLASDVAVSPDGKFIAYTIDKAIYVVPTGGTAPPRVLRAGYAPSWSPDSTRIAFYSTTDGSAQIWIADRASWAARPVTTLQGGVNQDPNSVFDVLSNAFRITWSSAGDKIAFAMRLAVVSEDNVEPESEHDRLESRNLPLVLNNDTPSEWTMSGIFSNGPSRPRWHDKTVVNTKNGNSDHFTGPSLIGVLDLNTLDIVKYSDRNNSLFNPIWAPFSDSLVAVRTKADELAGTWTSRSEIVEIDTATGSTRVLAFPSGLKWLPSPSPNGDWWAFLARDTRGSASVFIANKDGSGFSKIDDLSGGEPISFRWMPDSRRIMVEYLNTTAPYNLVISSIDGLRSERVRQSDVATQRNASVSQNGMIAWFASTPDDPGSIFVRDGSKGGPRRLVALNPDFANRSLAKQIQFDWKTSRGERRTGTILFPVNNPNGRRLPVVVNPYPKSTTFGFNGSATSPTHYLASQGFLVFIPGPRSPQILGESLDGDKVPSWSQSIDDVTSGLRELDTRGLIDPEKVALYGFSLGGAVAQELAAQHSELFKCGIAVSSGLGFDWDRGFFLSSETQQRVLNRLVGATPWEKPDIYRDLSTKYRAGSINIPMLLAAGDSELEYLLSMVQLYNALKFRNVPVTFIRYPSQGHGLIGDNLEDFWRRGIPFLSKCLSVEMP